MNMPLHHDVRQLGDRHEAALGGAVTTASPSATSFPSEQVTVVARRTVRPSPLAMTRTLTVTTSPRCTRLWKARVCDR